MVGKLGAWLRLVLVAACAGLVVAGSAQASFPGRNGRFAIDERCVGGSSCEGVTGPSLHTMALDGSDVRPVGCASDSAVDCASGAGAWSPDGKQLVFRAASYGYVIAAPDGSNERALIPADYEVNGVAWSPSGRFLVFAGYRSGESQRSDPAPAVMNLFVVSADGTEVRQLTYRGGYQPAWSSDGRIAFTRNARGRSNIYLVRGDGTGLLQVTRRGGASPDWSPHATRLSFTRARGRRGNIPSDEVYTMTAHGHHLRRLTYNRGGSDDTPVWSPDGRYLAYITHSEDGEPSTGGVSVERATGGTARRIGPEGPDSVTWQPLPQGPAKELHARASPHQMLLRYR